ncbi:MAG: protocatechuate 3,4-dioxygenase subunit alpha [Chloroflexota bacterium]|nr:MAG: protocatechuate 3,4-dioxygenase subunit alpha [Chloroflexota bacterium]
MLEQTASQTIGPYLCIGLIHGDAQNVLVNDATTGERITITGVVSDGNGDPITDAMVEIWQADANGIYNHPADPLHEEADAHFRGFGRAENPRVGVYEFKTIKPGGRDGQAPYINVHVFARGILIHAMTRIYFADEPANDGDPVLRSIDADRRRTLIASREESGDQVVYRFDIRMQGENETVFFNP